MTVCPFCAIIEGSAPSWIIHRTDKVICFLPRKCEVYGQTIIATIDHVQDIYTAGDQHLAAVIDAVKMLAEHYKLKVGATGINLLHASGDAAQQSVPHFHVHLIPRFTNDRINAWPAFDRPDIDNDQLLAKLIIRKSDD